MGDRTYARISIPARLLSDPAVKAKVTDILGITVADLDTVLGSRPPEPDEAAYENGISLRLVDDVPCLVWEDDQANYGASNEEDALVACAIPFLLVHGDGGEYGAGSTVHDAIRRVDVQLDRQEQIVAPIDTDGHRARLRGGYLAKITCYLATRRALFKAGR